MRLRPLNPRAMILAVALLAISCGSGDGGTDDAAEGGTSSTSVSSTSVGSQTTMGSVDGSEGSGTGGPTSCDDDPLVWEAATFFVGGIAVDASGNVYAGGTTGEQAGGNADAIVWTRTDTPMREEEPDLFDTVALGPDDSVFVAGPGFVRKYCP